MVVFPLWAGWWRTTAKLVIDGRRRCQCTFGTDDNDDTRPGRYSTFSGSSLSGFYGLFCPLHISSVYTTSRGQRPEGGVVGRQAVNLNLKERNEEKWRWNGGGGGFNDLWMTNRGGVVHNIVESRQLCRSLFIHHSHFISLNTLPGDWWRRRRSWRKKFIELASK